MRNTVAKRLRKIAKENTKGNYKKARVYVADEHGTIWAVADCAHGYYKQSKTTRKNKHPFIPSKRRELTESIKSLIGYREKEKSNAILKDFEKTS